MRIAVGSSGGARVAFDYRLVKMCGLRWGVTGSRAPTLALSPSLTLALLLSFSHPRSNTWGAGRKEASPSRLPPPRPPHPPHTHFHAERLTYSPYNGLRRKPQVCSGLSCQQVGLLRLRLARSAAGSATRLPSERRRALRPSYDSHLGDATWNPS